MNDTRTTLGNSQPMFGELEARLRQKVDLGGYDGYGTDPLQIAAADAIRDLRVALASQIEITNTERAEKERLTSLSMSTRSEAEIRLNDDKTLDEVVGRGVDAHLEQCDTGHWFLAIGDVAVWLYSKKAITASYERREPLKGVPLAGGEDRCRGQSEPSALAAEKSLFDNGGCESRSPTLTENVTCNASQPLKVESDGERLTISIGRDILAHAIQVGFDQQAFDFRVSDPAALLKSVRWALCREAEDGTTRVHELLDSAAEYALEQGGEGFEEITAHQRTGVGTAPDAPSATQFPTPPDRQEP